MKKEFYVIVLGLISILSFAFSSEKVLESNDQSFDAPSEFVRNLKSGEKLGSFFNDEWTFIYHAYDRCSGSTDGKSENLKSEQIDSVIKLQVKNNGDGWACEKKEPKTYDMDFDLKKRLTNWDRFEIPNYENQEKNIVHVVGAGESDSIILHYNDKGLIIRMEYNSVDPG